MIQSRPPTRRERLETALDQLQTLDATLDVAESQCPCCGLTRRTNWTEFQLHQEVEGFCRRISRFLTNDKVNLDQGT